MINKLNYNEKESTMYVPNELFTDLQCCIKKTNHIPFAYSYYYLVKWLYRYAKYGSVFYDNKMLKAILRYNPTYTEIDYIIKKNGILDLMNYTSTVKDYPISWTYDGDLDFEMFSDLDEDMKTYMKEKMSRKYTIKLPVKAFFRSEEEDVLDGTFYEVERTHKIPFEVFLFCMSNDELGCTGFYIWSYLQMQNQLFEGGYDISVDGLSEETGVKRRTLVKYLNLLRGYKMIDVLYNQEFFCVALKDEDRKANTYVTNDWWKFSQAKVDYQKLKIVKAEDYMRMKENVGSIDDLFM